MITSDHIDDDLYPASGGFFIFADKTPFTNSENVCPLRGKE